jgi:tRNA G46 methylase TrmB
MSVRFSTRCPNSDYLGFETSPKAIVAAAKKAEEVGFGILPASHFEVLEEMIVNVVVRRQSMPQTVSRLGVIAF